MTDNTQPEALRLADALHGAVQMYPQTSEDEPGGYCTEQDQLMDDAATALCVQHTRIAELEAQIEALSGVQALSAAPAGFVPVSAFDRLHAHAESLAARLLAAEQATHKAAPGEWTEQDALGILNQLSDGPFGQSDVDDALDFMRLVDTARRDKAAPGEQFDSEGFRAWVRQNLPDDTIIGSSAWWADHLTEWAQRFVKAAPQPAPAPLSEMPYEKRKAIQEGEQIGASDAWFKARHEMLDTVDRRNVFRAGFDRGWSAALAAPQQEAQEPSHQETVDVVGVRSNGEHVNLGKIAMPPRMKAREIAIEQFGRFKDDDGSDAEMCFGALEYFLEWLIQQGWSKAPQPAPAPLIARSLAEWHEEDGYVAWWAWNGREWAGEPAWIGTPNCEDWPGYHTHWTPHPEQPVCAALAAQGGKV